MARQCLANHASSCEALIAFHTLTCNLMTNKKIRVATRIFYADFLTKKIIEW